MGVKKLNFADVTNDFVVALNKQLKTQEIPMIMDVTLTTKGKSKVIKFTSANPNTGERTTLYSREYVAKNSAQFLKDDIDYVLYRELYYNCFAYYLINMESIVKQRQAEQAIANVEPSVAETPILPKDAISEALKQS